MRTKQARIIAIIDAYQSHFPGPFRMEAVANWALKHELWPVPKRGCTEQEAVEWAEKLTAAKTTPEVDGPEALTDQAG
jgi:hypothetical protein